MSVPSYIEAVYSNGRGMANMQYVYLRPRVKCDNKSRRVGAFYKDELWRKVDKVAKKWYSPEIKLYKIDNNIIASNNEENALKEWWKICDRQFIKMPFPVYLAQENELKQ